MHDTPQPHTVTTSSHRAAHAARVRSRRELRYWSCLAIAGSCALLVPLAAFGVTAHTDDGPSRALLAVLIPVFMGLAVHFSAAAGDAAHGLRGRP